jgi:putative transposase
MARNNNLPYRQSHRLPNYDYRQPGAYFITVCTHHREPLFGEIIDGQMQLNAAGRMVKSVWDDIPMFYPGIEIDEFIVMSDHVHGIIHIVGAAPCGRPDCENHCPPDCGNHRRPDQSVVIDSEPYGCRFDHALCDYNGRPQGAAPTVLSVSDVVHRFKSMTTHLYGIGVMSNQSPPYSRRLWQRNYWERIIRSPCEYQAVCTYIRNNPGHSKQK